jgi:Domain of unknown function (DUF4129)
VHHGARAGNLVRTDGRSADRAARALQLTLAIALIATTIVGVRAAAGLDWHIVQGPASRRIPVTAGLAVVLAILLTALLVLRVRRPAPGQPAAVLRRALIVIVSMLLAAMALAFLLSVLQGASSHKMPPSLLPKPSPTTTRHGYRPPFRYGHVTGGGDLGTLLVYAAMAALVAVAILAFLVLLRRRRALILEAPEPEPDDTDMLRSAVQAGQAALRSIADARQAIITCYAAMEGSLSQAGAERGAAETPDELLARVSADGIVHGAAAARLTRLFYEARFSDHEVTEVARLTALHSLADIELELDERARHLRVMAGR